MKPSKKKIIKRVVLAIIALIALSYGFCCLRCRNWPMKYFPNIIETVSDEEAQQIISTIDRGWLDNIRFGLGPPAYSSELYFITSSSFAEIQSFLEANQCHLWLTHEDTDNGTAVAYLFCERDDSGVLYFVEDATEKGNFVGYRYRYINLIRYVFKNCFRKPNLGE